MKKLLFVLLLLPVMVRGQVNLVRNPSLEDHWRIPVNDQEIAFANYWSCIDTLHTYPATGDTFGDPNCTPAYVNVDATHLCCSVPSAQFFHHYCRTGSGMAQVYMYYDNYDSSALVTAQREYLQGRLYTQLVAGQSYCVTFYVVATQSSKYAINSIGAYLDNGTIDTNSNCGFPHPEDVPQVMDTIIISDTVNWTKIQGSFIANGTEKYITIGNFHDTAHTAKITLYPFSLNTLVCYLVDDVSVINSSEVATAGPDVSIALGDTAWIGIDSNGDGMPCYWYVLGGTSPIDSGGRISVRPATTTTYVVSMDLCGNITSDTVTVTVGAESVGNVPIQAANVRIFPNPATTQLTISAPGSINSIAISNVMGQVVYSWQFAVGSSQSAVCSQPAFPVGRPSTVNCQLQTVDVSALPAGVYLVRVNNTVVRRFVKE
jgi:hypothetical protein